MHYSRPLFPALMGLALASPLPLTQRQTGDLVPSLSGPAADLASGLGGSYARTTFLADGSILGTYTTMQDNNTILELARSTDSGESWSNIGTAASRPTASSDLGNPFPLQLESGRILLAYRNHDKSGNTYLVHRIELSSSDDNGVTWTYLSTPAHNVALPTVNGLWEPFMRVAQDGTLQIFYSQENSAIDQDLILQTSSDGGATWSGPSTISGANITARDGMFGVAQLNKNKLIGVFESVPPGGNFAIHSITSSDDGVTWGDRQTVYTPTGTNNNAGAPQVANVGGVLCVSFMTDEDTQLHHWTDGAAAKMVTGTDGVTWGNKIQIFEPTSLWAGVMTLDDTSLLYGADAGPDFNVGGPKIQKVVLS